MQPARAARLLFQLPRACRVFTKLEPSNQWGWDEVFANKTNYLLELLLWQNGSPSKKGELAKHKRNKPKPFIPPFMKGLVEPSEISKGIEVHTTDDIRAILDKKRV